MQTLVGHFFGKSNINGHIPGVEIGFNAENHFYYMPVYKYITSATHHILPVNPECITGMLNSIGFCINQVGTVFVDKVSFECITVYIKIGADA
jgi:hypothetical protein